MTDSLFGYFNCLVDQLKLAGDTPSGTGSKKGRMIKRLNDVRIILLSQGVQY